MNPIYTYKVVKFIYAYVTCNSYVHIICQKSGCIFDNNQSYLWQRIQCTLKVEIKIYYKGHVNKYVVNVVDIFS